MVGTPTPANPPGVPASAERGSVSLELGLLAPVLVLVMLAAVQTAMYLHAVQVAETAAQDGLEAGRATGGSVSAARHGANDLLGDAGGINDARVVATGGRGEVTVEVIGTAPQVIPGVTWDVHARAVGRVEVFVPETAR